MKGLILFYHCNSYFLLSELQFNKLLQVYIYPQYIFKGKGTHHSKKMSCKSDETRIQNQHLFYLKNTGLIIEEGMCRMRVSTKEPVYFLVEEGNQCRVEQKGGGGS